MRKLLAFAFAWLLCGLSFAADLWQWTSKADHHRAVVQIRAGNAGGTGCLVWISEDRKKGIVLTAAHVVEGNQIAKARWENGYESAGVIAGQNAQYDVACFEVVPPEGAVAVPVVPDPVPFGTAGEACGYGGPGNQLRHFAVEAVEAVTDRTTWRGVVISGDSGGPIFVDVDGEKHLAGTVIGGPNVAPIQGVSDWQAVYPIYASRSSAARAILTQCYGGQCVPPSRGSPIQAPGYSSPLYPSQPVAPAPQPKTVEIDYDKLADAIVKKIGDDPKFRGPIGPAGPAGERGLDGIPGIPGERGPAGVDGKTPVIDDAVIAAIIAKLPPVRIAIERPDGSIVYDSKPLGEPIGIRLFSSK